MATSLFDDGNLEMDNIGSINYFSSLSPSQKDRTVNIIVVEDIKGGNNGRYNSIYDFILLDYNTFSNNTQRKSFPHELGHYFSLPHTHRGNERVNRNITCPVGWSCWLHPGDLACTRMGDGFCDTPADPRMSGKVSSCVYTGTDTDQNDDLYVPDVRNVMAYGNKSCRNWFSAEQRIAMDWQIANKNKRSFINDLNDQYLKPDKYEPDDVAFPGVPRFIEREETQHRSFHHTPDACRDINDWIRIDATKGFYGNVVIEIEDFPGWSGEGVTGAVTFWESEIPNRDARSNNEIIATVVEDGNKRIFTLPNFCVGPNTPDIYVRIRLVLL